MTGYTFASPSGLLISRTDRDIDFKRGIEFVAEALDRKRGAYLSSGVEDQALYTRWDFGFVDPPLELVARGRRLWVRALNERGTSILAMAKPILLEDPAVVLETSEAREFVLAVAESEGVFAEEERSRRPSVFTPIRSLLRELVGFEDGFLGLYGAFGYDLIFQFDPLPLRMPRGAADKVLHLYLPDRILVVDRRLEVARSYEYEFEKRGMSTVGCSEEAFAPLPRLLDLVEAQINEKSVFLLLKGQDIDKELTQATKYWKMRVERMPSLSDSHGTVLRLSEVTRERNPDSAGVNDAD